MDTNFDISNNQVIVEENLELLDDKKGDRKAFLSNIYYSIIGILACMSSITFVIIIFICCILSILSPLYYKKNPLDNPFLSKSQRLYLLQKKN